MEILIGLLATVKRGNIGANKVVFFLIAKKYLLLEPMWLVPLSFKICASPSAVVESLVCIQH